jgi:hypothetical protein
MGFSILRRPVQVLACKLLGLTVGGVNPYCFCGLGVHNDAAVFGRREKSHEVSVLRSLVLSCFIRCACANGRRTVERARRGRSLPDEMLKRRRLMPARLSRYI